MTNDSPLGPGVRLVIFDADDTLRRTLVAGQPCPRAPDEWELMPGVRERLGAIPWTLLDVRLGVASNQDQVGYGLISHATAAALLRDAVVAATAGAVTDPVIRLCPHRPDAGCACRKPQPGMLLDIITECGVSAAETLFVGNSDIDCEAARRARTRFAWAHEFFAASAPNTVAPF